jgi:enoyl-CoA hydratase/carnithine racemase
MTTVTPLPSGPLPETLELTVDGTVATLTLNRPEKRNALDDGTVLALGEFFRTLPTGHPDVKAVVLTAAGPHFCAGLDLSELSERDAVGGLHHSRMWHAAMNQIAESAVPVVVVLTGAVVGGGRGLATAAHLRVADSTTFFALPEGSRGLFVGGGASVRVPRLIGVNRMQDMMLTGRVLDAEEGERVGLANYLVAEGEGEEKARALAERIAENSPVTNYAVTQALPRIVESGKDEGYMLESLMAAVAQSSAEAKERMQDFLSGSGPKVRN